MDDERSGMKHMMFGKTFAVGICLLMLCASVPTLAIADQAHYIYDDLGRLPQVIDGQGNVATYAHAAVAAPSISVLTSLLYESESYCSNNTHPD